MAALLSFGKAALHLLAQALDTLDSGSGTRDLQKQFGTSVSCWRRQRIHHELTGF